MAFDPNQFPEKPKKPGSGRSFLPPGKHRVTAHVMETGDTVVVEFRRQGDGVSRKGWFPVDGGAAFTGNQLRAVGWSHPVDTYDIEDMRAILENVPLEIVCADEVWQGKTETKIRWTNRLPGTPDRAAREGQERDYSEDSPPPPDDPEIPF